MTEYDTKSATRKSEKDKKPIQRTSKESLVTVRELRILIGQLSFTALAVISASLPYRALQQQQIQVMIPKPSLEGKWVYQNRQRVSYHGEYKISVCKMGSPWFLPSATDVYFWCISPHGLGGGYLT